MGITRFVLGGFFLCAALHAPIYSTAFAEDTCSEAAKDLLTPTTVTKSDPPSHPKSSADEPGPKGPSLELEQLHGHEVLLLESRDVAWIHPSSRGDHVFVETKSRAVQTLNEEIALRIPASGMLSEGQRVLLKDRRAARVSRIFTSGDIELAFNEQGSFGQFFYRADYEWGHVEGIQSISVTSLESQRAGQTVRLSGSPEEHIIEEVFSEGTLLVKSKDGAKRLVPISDIQN